MLNELINMSVKLGSKVDYVQGGGGNTSVKDNELMYIKASGTFLKNMTNSSGFCSVYYKKILNCIANEDFNDFNRFNTDSKSRASIETGFHALLGKNVLHSHSVYANVLTCSVEGEKLVKEMFPDAVFVSYGAPGKDLTLLIKNKIKGKKNGIIFLKNHGLIVSGDNESVLNIHDEVNYKIKQRLNLPDFSCDIDASQHLEVMKKNILFPDQVVYTLADSDVLNTVAAKETIAAHKYIFDSITNVNLTVSCLKSEEIQILINMESEKYRLGVLKNDTSKP